MRVLLLFAALVILAACGAAGMPDIDGMTIEEATELLDEADIGYQVIERHEDDENLHGTVVNQYPDAGESLDEVEQATIAVAVEPTFDVEGTFLLRGSSGRVEGGGCRGSGGYRDFGDGMRVTVRDGDGNVIGTGTTHSSERLGVNRCQVQWEVEGLPQRDFYAIEIGSRGEMTYSFDEMREMDWTVNLTLG